MTGGKSKGDNTFAASNGKTHTLFSYFDLVFGVGEKYKNKKLFEFYKPKTQTMKLVNLN